VVQYFLNFVYGLTTAVVFLLSIGNDPVWTRRAYRWCSIIYAVLFAIMTVVQIVSLFASVRWYAVRVRVSDGSVWALNLVCGKVLYV